MIDKDSIFGFYKKNKISLILVFFFLIIIAYYNFNSVSSKHDFQSGKSDISTFEITKPVQKWGFALDTFDVKLDTIQNNQFFGEVMQENEVPYPIIEQIIANSKDFFDVNTWRAGKGYAFLKKEKSNRPDYLVYEPSVYKYYLFDLHKGTGAVVEKPIVKQLKTASGVIASSLWKTMTDAGLSFDLAGKMEGALQWSIDFHHAQKGDQFKLFYEEESIEGQVVGVGALHAAAYKTGENEFQAVYFEDGEHPGYYDPEGRPMNKGFLKSPVKYSRISSRFNRRRFHPVLKRVRPHLGTDYAAPRGTPIYAVGDGVVLEARRRGGNGNYVKIRHNETYQTQYLHMQKFAKGVSSGTHVKQGQVIGYVGSTGLATGPHVCFRFWKNGRQVNHLNLEFPPPKPLPAEEMDSFVLVKDKFLAELNQIDYPALIEEPVKSNIEEKESQSTDNESIMTSNP